LKKVLPSDFAERIRSGVEAEVRRGRVSSGTLPYGYCAAPEGEDHLVARARNPSINASEAAIVIRIFELFTSGKSPRAIARELNAEGIARRDNSTWTEAIVRGHSQRGAGILRNEIYIGRVIWNRQQFRRDAVTGRYSARLNPKDDWVVVDVPQLRIVAQNLWERAQQRLQSRGNIPAAQAGRKYGVGVKGPRRHMFDGLVKCPVCGGGLMLSTRQTLLCAVARNGGSCSNQKEISRLLFEQIVTEVLANRVASRGLTHRRVLNYCRAIKRFQKHIALQKAAIEYERRSIRMRLASLTKMFDLGMGDKLTQKRATELTVRNRNLDSRLVELRQLSAEFPPNLPKEFRQRVRSLIKTLLSQQATVDIQGVWQSFIDKIVVRQFDGLLKIELFGDITNLLEPPDESYLSMCLSKQRSVKIASGTWFLAPSENQRWGSTRNDER
jgi:site-specific DNA recombinase